MVRGWLALWVLAGGCQKDAPSAPAPVPETAHVLGATPRPQPGRDAAVAARVVEADPELANAQARARAEALRSALVMESADSASARPLRGKRDPMTSLEAQMAAVRDSPRARTRLGNPSGLAASDRENLRRMLQRNLAHIQACYQARLVVSPDLAGTVTLDFTMTAQGAVEGAKASGMDPTVASCVADVVGGLSFPAPAGAAPLVVHYPISFARQL